LVISIAYVDSGRRTVLSRAAICAAGCNTFDVGFEVDSTPLHVVLSPQWEGMDLSHASLTVTSHRAPL